MQNQEQKFRTSVGSFTGSSGLSGSPSAFQLQSGTGSSSLNIGHLRSSTKEKAGGGSGGGSTSLGFIAINCIVLGIVGYTFMADDTSATTDATGGFSFFKSQDENSFAVKPGTRIATRSSQFDWSRKKTGGSQLSPTSFASLDGFSFGDAGAPKSSGQASVGTFLAPGQIEEIFSTLPNVGGASGSDQNYGPATGARDRGNGAGVFDTTLATTSKYQRYSVSTLQEPQTRAERNTVAIENAANGGQQSTYRVLKGRLAGVSGQGSRNGVLNLHVSHGAKSEISKVALKGIENKRAMATLYPIAWSSEMASYFYLLESGVTGSSSSRLQALTARTISAAEQAGAKPNEMSLSRVSARLTELTEQSAYLIYVIEDVSDTGESAVRAILLQDLAERKWQVIRLEPRWG